MARKAINEAVAMARIQRMKDRAARAWYAAHYQSTGRGQNGMHPGLVAFIERLASGAAEMQDRSEGPPINIKFN